MKIGPTTQAMRMAHAQISGHTESEHVEVRTLTPSAVVRDVSTHPVAEEEADVDELAAAGRITLADEPPPALPLLRFSDGLLARREKSDTCAEVDVERLLVAEHVDDVLEHRRR